MKKGTGSAFLIVNNKARNDMKFMLLYLMSLVVYVLACAACACLINYMYLYKAVCMYGAALGLLWSCWSALQVLWGCSGDVLGLLWNC